MSRPSLHLQAHLTSDAEPPEALGTLAAALRLLSDRQRPGEIVSIETPEADQALERVLEALSRPDFVSLVGAVSQASAPVGLLAQLAQGDDGRALGGAVGPANRSRLADPEAAVGARGALLGLWESHGDADICAAALTGYCLAPGATIPGRTGPCTAGELARWGAAQMVGMPVPGGGSLLVHFLGEFALPPAVEQVLLWRRLGVEIGVHAIQALARALDQDGWFREAQRLAPWQEAAYRWAWHQAESNEGAFAALVDLLARYTGERALGIRLEIFRERFGFTAPGRATPVSPPDWAGYPTDPREMGRMLALRTLKGYGIEGMGRPHLALLQAWGTRLGPEGAPHLWALLDHPSLAIQAGAMRAIVAFQDSEPWRDFWERSVLDDVWPDAPRDPVDRGGDWTLGQGLIRSASDAGTAAMVHPPRDFQGLTREELWGRFSVVGHRLLTHGYLVGWGRLPLHHQNAAVWNLLLCELVRVPEALSDALAVTTGAARDAVVRVFLEEKLDPRRTLVLTVVLEQYLRGEVGGGASRDAVRAGRPLFTEAQALNLLQDGDPGVRELVLRTLAVPDR